jgi:allantoicase
LDQPADLQIPHFVNNAVNLASPRLGSAVLLANDEFFGAADRMLADKKPVFIPDKFDEHGQWMDGWETRRRRTEGHDWCVIRLGAAGSIFGVDIDTSYFTGNFPPEASLEGVLTRGDPEPNAMWRPIVSRTAIRGDSRNFIESEDHEPVSHIRLNIFPDGGVARLRLFGIARPDWSELPPDEKIELSAVGSGGRAIAYSDAHYGDPWVILTPGRGINMGDGWETRRRRTPGNDWIVIELGHKGMIDSFEIDTAHFKGNYPAGCSVDGYFGTAGDPLGDDAHWEELLPRTDLGMDAIHHFHALPGRKAVSHVRLNIFPDGGISRFRAFGKRTFD